MCTAWNSAMVWVDNELVFTELNTLMTVARDATDKVIEAMSWAEKNKMKEKPIDTRKQLQDTPPPLLLPFMANTLRHIKC